MRTFSANVFGAGLASKIAARLGPKLLPATLAKSTSRERATASPADGTRLVWTEYAARGTVELTAAGDDGTRKVTAEVMLLGGSLAGGVVPESGDRVTIAGATYLIGKVEGDPAGATWTCQATQA